MKHRNKSLLKLCVALAFLVTAVFPGAQGAFAAPSEAGIQAVAAAEPGRTPTEITAAVSENTKFHGAILSVSPEAFTAAGYVLGDSVDLLFSNGFELTDVPYYNGYYTDELEPLLVAYPGAGTVEAKYNYGDLWAAAGLTEGDTVTVRLRAAGKYLATQEALGQAYSDHIADYDSTVRFCNFRALSGGRLKKDFLFRGASPVDNRHNRAPYTDQLLRAHGIRFVINLADNETDLESYQSMPDFGSVYTVGLYREGRVALMDMDAAYKSEDFCRKTAEALKATLPCEGPVYIHCLEGKDRTGFVCLLLEALAGASYEEMLDDYMTTYENYYGITAAGTPEKYDAVVNLYADSYLSYIHSLGSPDAVGHSEGAEAYLIRGGMTAKEVAALKAMITE